MTKEDREKLCADLCDPLSNVLIEEEARKRWCPFARSFDYPGGAGSKRPVTVNRGSNDKPDPWCHCIASECMAWRWASGTELASGYCGLAGAP